ncbi:MAG: acyl-CoA dehydrogenase [Alphaproteobacteria bacterium]|nr:acyl-CoA dehydrogenase [Alphaproteobacteria bacterium]
MTDYRPPIREMQFVLQHVVGLERLAALPGGEAVETDLVGHVLEEAGKLAADVLAPLNRVGDREPARLDNGVVRTPPGFREAYRHYVEGGWNSVPFPPDHGGQGLPWVVATAVQEMWNAANMGWALGPMLTVGAVEALAAHGTAEQKRLYLPKLVSGEWTGTMNLTEPQAGSDVGALRTRAVREGDHYRITGQKIFITYGDQDWTDNIVHLVLARLPDAPAGSRGISLFLVPKFLVRSDGSLGERNDLRVVSLEHKLGIHASPTCVMAYGDNGGAIGTLIGKENEGLACMFTMMNNMRLDVGIQGVALAERAYQHALGYARQRVQSRDLGSRSAEPVAILRHPDVRRMLMTMKALTEATRALAYSTFASLDLANRLPPGPEQAAMAARADLLTPVVKAWSTDVGCDVASLGVQIHGGMGFIEETGAAQYYRDVRITPIYEGTNGIQANDLVFRKVGRDKGVAARAFLAEIREIAVDLAAQPGDDAAVVGRALGAGHDALEGATDWIVASSEGDHRHAAASAAAYLRLFGIVAGGAMMARQICAAQRALAVQGSDSAFLETRIAVARFYADHVLSQAPALVHPIVAGATSALALDDDRF